MRPARQNAEQRQKQNYQQNGSKHDLLLCSRSIDGATPRGVAPVHALHRDIDGNADVGISAVVHVVAVVDIGDIHFVVVVPVVAPVFRPRINGAEPVPFILKTWIPAYNQKGKAAEGEAMSRSEVSAEAIVGNAVAAIPASLLPGAVIRLPMS